MAIAESETWAVTLLHIENDRHRPVKRTTLMWDGTDWANPADGFESGRVRRRAVVGPVVENTTRPPFYCITLDEIRIDDVKPNGAIWGRVTKTSGIRYEDAGHDLEAGRDALLDLSLEHCSHAFGVAGNAMPTVPSDYSVDRQRQTNFALANQVAVLAFASPSAPNARNRSTSLSAIRANLADALYRPDFAKRGERLDLTLGDANNSDSLETLQSFIGDLPMVTAVHQRDRLGSLSTALKRAGLRPISANQRLSVNVSESNNEDLGRVADRVLAAAGTRKRIDSGWLSTQRLAAVSPSPNEPE
ncbi:MAG: hypothetical protein OXQ29_08820 [Rhodospirillaceae bacterium]|nr:hypothetical protein [Rhodospirillaceae bacterium]